MTETYSKHWENKGYTMDEALKKKHAVDEAKMTSQAYSKWESAVIIPDERGGYKVEVSTKMI